MRKASLQFILAWLVAFIIIGCDSKTKTSTPENGFKEFINAFATLDPNKHVDNFAQQSILDQNVSKEELLKSITKTFNDFKFKKFVILDHQLLSVKNITPNIALIEANIKYKIGDGKEEIEKNHYIFINENGSWKYSLQNFIKKEVLKTKCGESKKINICINEIYYYANQIYFHGTIENNSNQVHRFGFGSSSNIKLNDDKGIVASYDYPKLGSNISPIINKGKSDIGFVFDIDSSLMAQSFLPKIFSVDNILPMNGELPAGFNNEFAVNVKLN